MEHNHLTLSPFACHKKACGDVSTADKICHQAVKPWRSSPHLAHLPSSRRASAIVANTPGTYNIPGSLHFHEGQSLDASSYSWRLRRGSTESSGTFKRCSVLGIHGTAEAGSLLPVARHLWYFLSTFYKELKNKKCSSRQPVILRALLTINR